ncbi:TPA: restriction endonuclease subunit S [Legionella pneumophila]|nr:hypothetical protein [Legionella pneumophila]
MNSFSKQVKLEEVCYKITDGTHKTPIYQDNGIIFISAKNVKNGRLCFKDHKYISETEHNQLIKRCNPEAGDVMLSKSGSLGDAVVVPQLPFSFSIFESLALIKVKKDILLPEYLQQYLNSSLSKRYFWSITSGIAVKHLHLVDIRKMPIYIPSLKLQKLIQQKLTIWDNVIEKTEALIAAKAKLLARQFNDLITSQIGSKDWNSDKLIKLVDIKKGKQLNKTLLTKEGLFPAWNGGITPSGYTDKWNTSENTITISEGGNSCGFVNYSEEKFWCGGHCYALSNISKKIEVEFLYYFLKAYEKKIMKLRVGSGLPNIQKPDLEKLVVHFPEKNKQLYISKALKIAKSEIELLRKLSTKYKQQKKGLMIKLLTGEWRVDSGVPHD